MNYSLQLNHHPRNRPVKRIPFSYLVKSAFFTLGLPAHAFCSIDVTARCNLRCKHCYFWEQGYSQELSVDEWLSLMERLKRESWPRPFFAYQCSWVGGEPLLRQEVIAQAKKYFPYNIVVTNGTLPLPDWPDVHFFISADGTHDIHDSIRGKGSYERIKAHANRNDLDVMITYCINRLNIHCIEEFISEWDATTVQHVAFEFYTPIAGLPSDSELSLSLAERDEVLDLLLALKEIYGHFILPPARTYRLMHSSHSLDVTKHCLYREKAVVFGPDGNIKKPCMLGPKAYCDRCGCIIPFISRAQVDRKEILRDLWQGICKIQ